MALTRGTGPFGREPAGSFNFCREGLDHVLYLEDSPRRVRVVVAGETIADSTHVRLLHETGRLPVYHFPESDVRMDLLVTSDHSTQCLVKGVATYWSIRVGRDERTNAAWSHRRPTPGCPPLDGLVAFDWHAVDEWWEEAEQVHVHARDPYHRCDVLRTDRHVVVRVGGVTVADSRRAVVLFETGHPPRWYLPVEDVDHTLLAPSDTVTQCPYKGTTTRYHHVVAGGATVADAAWVYGDPRPEVGAIVGRIAFHDERVELEVDGSRTLAQDQSRQR